MPILKLLTKLQWIEKYGGQALLDREGFEVVPCENCDDSICHGWKVVPKSRIQSVAVNGILSEVGSPNGKQ